MTYNFERDTDILSTARRIKWGCAWKAPLRRMLGRKEKVAIVLTEEVRHFLRQVPWKEY